MIASTSATWSGVIRTKKSKLLALRAAIQEGLDSGDSDRTVGEIWAEAEARHQAKNG